MKVHMRVCAAALLGTALGSAAVQGAHAQNFTGTWGTRTDKNWTYDVTLNTNGAAVTGKYTVTTAGEQAGTQGLINGTVSGRVLQFSWSQDYRRGGVIQPNIFHGTAQYTLSADGNSFTGTYQTAPHSLLTPDLLHGTWSGTRKVAGTLGQRIVQYAQTHLGHCIDSAGADHAAACSAPQGECTHLVQAALAYVHAKPPNFSGTPYVWGTHITSGPYQIGDILQFTNAKLQGSNGYWETGTQHTAIIETINPNNVLGVLEQNSNNQRIVTRGTVNLGWTLVRGRIDRYRAE
jgi:hypothetical protein